MKPSWLSLKHILFAFATLCFLWGIFFHITTAKRLFYPFSLDICEIFSLHRSLLLAQGHSIYSPLGEYPYLVGNYPPVYEWLVSRFLDQPSYFPGRALSWVSQIGVCLLLGVMAYQWTGSFVAFLLACSLPSLSACFWVFGALHRVDFLALFFNFAALFVFFSLPLSLCFLSLPLFWLSGFTKQTFFLAPLLASYWVCRRNLFLGVLFLLLYILGGTLLLVYLNQATKGYFLLHTVWSQQNQISLSRAVDMAFRPIGKMLPLVVLSFWACFSKEKSEKEKWLLLYMGAAWLWIWLSGGKEGSSWNYFLELVCLFSLYFSVFVLRRLEFSPKILCLFFVAQLGYSFSALPRKDHTLWEKSQWFHKARVKLLKEIQKQNWKNLFPYGVRSEMVLNAADAVVLSGRRVNLNIHYYLMVRGGIFPKGALEYPLAAALPDVVITDVESYPLLFAYRLDQKIGPWYIWVKN